MSIISTSAIFEAITYYKELGYQMLDVPYCVDKKASDHTKPDFCKDFCHEDGKVYVGSAEQGFIELHNKGVLPDGKYMALTPCYRDEVIYDKTHYMVFLKLELIIVGKAESKKVLEEAYKFFSKHFNVRKIKTEESIESFDLISELNEIEVGSYGVRKMIDGTIYTYGTGIAEPRFSNIKTEIISH